MNKIILSLAFTFVSFSLLAQNKAVITGTVINKTTQLPVDGVSVTVEKTQAGTATD